ncbi:5-oxoprolinase subunit PxpB [Aureisphaera galaxeae]|uniref:5-oxoprolinase subunit PxpB n=1 Tax=Aureisphaera galaxeae TaxID=1538023 RepID=UPI002350087B|nr:5-oxoprolinase subunit PxpB [Aureisphaera galaxeae]MDC8002556.1 5-oxoprolinase subunit PxpB [Aureisphaera galaxeae]
MKPPSFQRFGDRAALISWESIIDAEVHAEAVRWDRFMTENYGEEILETVVTYQSLVVYLKEGVDPDTFLKSIKASFKTAKQEESTDEHHLITIPVCYEKDFAPDLENVAHYHNLSKDEVIQLHSEAMYKVYFLGFLPGFPYLGKLNPKLHTPRKDDPRPIVAQGSVGIGGKQTGIYPMDSPGGWNLIGRSPLSFFNPTKQPPAIIEAGDYVKFKPISTKEFEHIHALVENGIYLLDKVPYHD